MKLTKGKISKLYSKKKQTLKKYKNGRAQKNRRPNTFRKRKPLILNKKTLKKMTGGENTQNDVFISEDSKFPEVSVQNENQNKDVQNDSEETNQNNENEDLSQTQSFEENNEISTEPSTIIDNKNDNEDNKDVIDILNQDDNMDTSLNEIQPNIEENNELSQDTLDIQEENDQDQENNEFKNNNETEQNIDFMKPIEIEKKQTIKEIPEKNESIISEVDFSQNPLTEISDLFTKYLDSQIQSKIQKAMISNNITINDDGNTGSSAVKDNVVAMETMNNTIQNNNNPF
jgi:hypothetical protein